MATATPEAVAAAAEALQAAGKRVSTIAVQGHLGGGSFTTVQKYLEAWQQGVQKLFDDFFTVSYITISYVT